jgi:hypothetical protein
MSIKSSLSAGILVISALPMLGCGALAKMVEGVFGGPDASFTRVRPAEEDLANTSTIAVSEIEGRPEDVNAVSGHLGTWLSSSGRFAVVEREKLAQIAQEKGCAPGDVACVSGALPASAMVLGTVTPSTYSENLETNTYKCKQDGKDATCTERIRKGAARASVNLRLVDTATGKVLFQRLVTKTVGDSKSSYDGVPEPIDSGRLTEEARRQAALEFFEAISPHESTEEVELETDGALPSLERGNDAFKAGNLKTALQEYQSAVAMAEASKDINPEAKARAYYCAGVALGAIGKYDEAIERLNQAHKLNQDEDWARMTARVSLWKAEAARVEKQLAFAKPSQPAADSAPSAMAQ